MSREKDTGHCKKCDKPICFVVEGRPRGRMLDVYAEHRKDTKEKLLDPRWLSSRSLDERLDELAERCPYEPPK